MKASYRVSYAFAGFSDTDLNALAIVIIICLKNNLTFPNLPVKIADLTALQVAFQNCINAMLQGSTPQLTAQRDEAREALVVALKKTGACVQSVALDSLSALLSSGSQPILPSTASSPLDKPGIALLDNLETTLLLLRINPVANARSYQIQISDDGGKTWQERGFSTQARRIVLSGLTPGTVYAVRVKAIGGSTNESAWSDPMSRMAT